MKRSELKRSSTPAKRRPISPASTAQRKKARWSVCRACGSEYCDPAHVVDRSLGGCDGEQCVIPLCRICHSAYDLHTLDVLPLLTRDEQAHAVTHLGLLGALKRTTNVDWQAA